MPHGFLSCGPSSISTGARGRFLGQLGIASWLRKTGQVRVLGLMQANVIGGQREAPALVGQLRRLRERSRSEFSACRLLARG